MYVKYDVYDSDRNETIRVTLSGNKCMIKAIAGVLEDLGLILE